MCPDGFGPKKKPFGFDFRGLWTIPDVIVYLNDGEGWAQTGASHLNDFMKLSNIYFY